MLSCNSTNWGGFKPYKQALSVTFSSQKSEWVLGISHTDRLPFSTGSGFDCDAMVGGRTVQAGKGAGWLTEVHRNGCLWGTWSWWSPRHLHTETRKEETVCNLHLYILLCITNYITVREIYYRFYSDTQALLFVLLFLYSTSIEIMNGLITKWIERTEQRWRGEMEVRTSLFTSHVNIRHTGLFTRHILYPSIIGLSFALLLRTYSWLISFLHLAFNHWRNRLAICFMACSPLRSHFLKI